MKSDPGMPIRSVLGPRILLVAIAVAGITARQTPSFHSRDWVVDRGAQPSTPPADCDINPYRRYKPLHFNVFSSADYSSRNPQSRLSPNARLLLGRGQAAAVTDQVQ